MPSFKTEELKNRPTRPVPITQEEVERLGIIDEVCTNNHARHCLPRLLVRAEGRKSLIEIIPECPYTQNGCQGKEWCVCRDYLYKNSTARYVAQGNAVEGEEWVLGVHEHQPETYHHALEVFSANGGGELFAYAWEYLGIRDLDSLRRLCVYTVLDTTPIIEPNPPKESK